MLRKFFKHRKYKKMVKASSSFILEEFAKIVDDTIKMVEEDQSLTSLKKEVLKFEATALVFWLFQKTDIFPELWHKLLLDEIHNQYYERLKRYGYDSKMRQLVCDDFNLRYKTYNKIFEEDRDLSKVATKFARFLSERSKTDLNTGDIMIPGHILEELEPKFKEWCKVIENTDGE